MLARLPVAKGNWTGVRLAVILDKAGVSAEAVKIAFYAEDGYATDLKVEDAKLDGVIIAYEKDGEPLYGSTPQHPSLRLVVPGAWGYKWISEINHIELVNFDFKGPFESKGYPDALENVGER